MKALAAIVAVLLIVAHVLFFVGESFLYETYPRLRQTLGFSDPAEPSREAVVIAQNQGYSNLCLAIGVAVGLVLDRRGRPEGRVLLMLFSAFIAVAGVVGVCTVWPPDIKGRAAFLVGQTGLGLVSLLLALRKPAG